MQTGLFENKVGPTVLQECLFGIVARHMFVERWTKG